MKFFSCCLYCKGKNFRANHNLFLNMVMILHAVAYIAKVRILEQITTDYEQVQAYICCCLYCKGKNFRANHNYEIKHTYDNHAVAYIAKVRILEQITTMRPLPLAPSCCCLYCKGKNFRANHNNFSFVRMVFRAVAYIAKVRILEQITTQAKQLAQLGELLLILQR